MSKKIKDVPQGFGVEIVPDLQNEGETEEKEQVDANN